MFIIGCFALAVVFCFSKCSYRSFDGVLLRSEPVLTVRGTNYKVLNTYSYGANKTCSFVSPPSYYSLESAQQSAPHSAQQTIWVSYFNSKDCYDLEVSRYNNMIILFGFVLFFVVVILL